MNDDTRPIDLHGDPDDETARLLRRALTQEADMVHPDDRLGEITDRIDDDARPRWVPALAVVAAVAAVVLGIGVAFGIGGGDDPVTPAGGVSATSTPTTPASGPSPTTTSEPTAEPTSSEPTTTEPPATTTSPAPGDGDPLPVYWVGEQGSRFALFREFGAAGPTDAAERVQAAVEVALRGSPQDPDYTTPWAGASATTFVDGVVIGIDLSGVDGDSVGSELAVVAVQQLVWTATAAAGENIGVQFTVDGEPADLFGTVDTTEPIRRGTGTDDPRALVWIGLGDGAGLGTGTTTVAGEGVNAFENTLVWRLERAGTLVDEGFFGVVGAGGDPVDTGERGTWELALDVADAGTYTLTVEVPDASDGESTVRSFDTKTLTVS